MNGIEIRKVETKGDLKKFIRFPWSVYKNDPHWVPPLIIEMKDKLNRRKHPFFEHGEAEYFLAGRRKITGVRAMVFGVVPEFMHTGLAYLLYDEFEKAIIRKGYYWCELSWQLEDNQAINLFAASIGASLYRKYRIYEKQISAGGA